jgi:hypothetical protein
MGGHGWACKAINKVFSMRKVLVRSLAFLYSFAMSNDFTSYQFAIYNGQSVYILEQFGTLAWISFEDGEEQEVSMFDLELI